MDNNEFIRRVRYALQIDDAKAARLIELGGGRASVEDVAAWRLKESDAGYLACSDEVVEILLAGLITDRRSTDPSGGRSDGSQQHRRNDPSDNRPVGQPRGNTSGQVSGQVRSQVSGQATGKTGGVAGRAGVASETVPLTARDAINNVRFKQLRIALAMRSDDVEATLKAGGSALSSSEVAALFRKPGARNFRRCGDQSLRHFLTGLTKGREGSGAVSRPSAPGSGASSPWPTKR